LFNSPGLYELFSIPRGNEPGIFSRECAKQSLSKRMHTHWSCPAICYAPESGQSGNGADAGRIPLVKLPKLHWLGHAVRLAEVRRTAWSFSGRERERQQNYRRFVEDITGEDMASPDAGALGAAIIGHPDHVSGTTGKYRLKDGKKEKVAPGKKQEGFRLPNEKGPRCAGLSRVQGGGGRFQGGFFISPLL
jgi:hypothetical protein